MHRPWMTALEMQFATMRNMARLQQHLAGPDAPDDLQAAPETLTSVGQRLEQAAHVLRAAEAFSWTTDAMSAVAQAAATIPEDTALSDFAAFPNPAYWWWWFDTPLPFLIEDEHYPTDRRTVHGLLVIHGCLPTASVGSVLVIPFGLMAGHRLSPMAGQPFMFPLGWEWHLNESLAQLHARYRERPSNLPRPISRFLAAAMVWLEQRILVQSAGPVERHRRKQIARDHAVPLPGDVKVIQLRRAEHEAQPQSDRSVLVEWSCRWIVSGHWRNQPVKDGRKLIYILPYVKGPADQPLKVPAHTVYDVSR